MATKKVNGVYHVSNTQMTGSGIDSVTVSVDNTSGTPAGSASLDDGVLSLSFTGLKGATGPQGAQGNTGSSVDYPYELVNNLTTDDATKGLSAAQGVVLEGEVSQLSQKLYKRIVTNHSTSVVSTTGSWNAAFFDEVIPAGAIITGVTGLTGFYFCKQDGGYFPPVINPNITVFPITLDQDAYGITSSGAQSGTVQYQIVTVVDILEQVQAGLEELNDKVISTNEETVTVEGAASYTEVRFEEVIPAGTVISYFTQTGNGTFYLTDTDGNYDANLSSNTIKNLLPYKTTKDYRGIKTSSAFNVTFAFMGELRVDKARPEIIVQTTDTEFDILEKFRYAFMRGNIDIVFQKGVYTLKEIYPFMQSALGWMWTMGLPVGNGCRYFGNGSTINSVAPSDPSYADDRNIFDTKASGSSFEMYDFNLHITGGTYCVHDEGHNTDVPYFHKYENVNMRHTNATRCLGVGTGFDAELEIINCNFIGTGNPIAIHAPTVNPDSDAVTLHLTIMGCYMSEGRPFTLNSATFDVNRDDITVKYVGNSAADELDQSTVASITTLYNFNNVVR